MIVLIYSLILTVFTEKVLADVQFVKVYGTGGVERARAIVMANGGYILAGTKAPDMTGNYDVIILKTDLYGNLLWGRSFDAGIDDRAYSLISTSGGNYAVLGYTELTNRDYLVIKFNSMGNIIWKRRIGGGDKDMGVTISNTDDGGYILVGQTWSYGAGLNDFLLVKLTQQGDLEWAKTIGGGNNEVGMSVIQTSDGGYAALGNTHSFGSGGSDFLLVKLDSQGNLEWAKAIGGTDWEAPLYRSLIQTSDKGYVITGYTQSFGAGDEDILITKLDSTGALLWSTTVGGIYRDEPQFLMETNDGNYMVTGTTYSFGSNPYYDYNIMFAEFSSDGGYNFSRIIEGSAQEIGTGLTQDSTGGYLLTGATASFGSGVYDVIFSKIDYSGNTCYEESISPTVTHPNLAVMDVTPTVISVSPFVVEPQFFFVDSIYLSEQTICENVDVQEGQNHAFKLSEILYHSSIFRDRIRIDFSSLSDNFLKIKLYDIKGTPVYEKTFESVPRILIINEKNIKNLKSGIYFLNILMNKKEFKRFKIIKP